MAWLKKKRSLLLAACILALLFLLFIRLLADSYQNYKDTITGQSQEYLQVLASTVADNLNLYISGEVEKMRVLTESLRFQQEWLSYYHSNDVIGLKQYILNYILMLHHDLCRLYLLDNTGLVVFQYDRTGLLAGVDEEYLAASALQNGGLSGIGSTFEIADHQYAISLMGSVYIEDAYMGSVVGIWDLQSIYNELIASVQMDGDGYLTVADAEGNVLMHPAEYRIGHNLFSDAHLYQEEYQDETRAMRRQQYQSATGSAVYASRWWQGDGAPQVTKLCSWAHAPLGDTFWLVSAVVDARSTQELSNDNLAKLIALALCILLLVFLAVAGVYQINRRRLALEYEAHRLKEHNRTLEALNQSREQLRHYQKMEILGTFASGIAHEFNNLLTPIIGLSGLLREDLQGPLHEDADTIYQSGLKAQEIIAQIHTFGRKGPGRESFCEFSLDDCLHDALRVVRAIMLHSIVLHTNFCHGNTRLFGSKTQLHQVVLNLCSNAHQAMEPGGGTLTIETRLLQADALPPSGAGQPRSGQYVALIVADTGCGMADETLQRIFDPFFTTKESGKGTGLGLSLAQSIIMAHDGFIDVQSIEGQGSRFAAYLPVPQGGEEPAPCTRAAVLHSHAPASIIIIDDEREVLLALARLLQRAGHRVETFTDSTTALQTFQSNSNSWDLIITDYTMPGFNGAELARIIRTFRQDIPILLITGLSSAELAVAEPEPPFNDVLHKPLDFEALSGKIAALLAAAQV